MKLGKIIITAAKYTIGIKIGVDIGNVIVKIYRKGVIKACKVLEGKLDDVSEEKEEEAKDDEKTED